MGERAILQLTQHLRPDSPTLSSAQSGAAQYLSVTVFEGATPAELLEFFNDDAHRMTW